MFCWSACQAHVPSAHASIAMASESRVALSGEVAPTRAAALRVRNPIIIVVAAMRLRVSQDLLIFLLPKWLREVSVSRFKGLRALEAGPSGC